MWGDIGWLMVKQETFDKGYISEDWTDSFLRPILKPGKDRHMHKLNW